MRKDKKDNHHFLLRQVAKQLISEFVKDLKELQYGFNMGMFRDKIKNWEKKLE